jgi:hypothetical protein
LRPIRQLHTGDTEIADNPSGMRNGWWMRRPTLTEVARGALRLKLIAYNDGEGGSP